MKRQVVLLLRLVLVSACGLWAASFDCTKARSKVEKAICADPELSKLDDQLAVVYKSALAAHPLPSYIRARQRAWLNDLLLIVDEKHFISSLRKEFSTRVEELKNAIPVMVYSDARQTFSYGGGDSVAELWQQGHGKWSLTVWGGFHIHRLLTQEDGFDVFMGCDFEGDVLEPFRREGTNVAVNGDERVSFVLSSKLLSFGEEVPGCEGFGHIADELQRVLKK